MLLLCLQYHSLLIWWEWKRVDCWWMPFACFFSFIFTIQHTNHHFFSPSPFSHSIPFHNTHAMPSFNTLSLHPCAHCDVWEESCMYGLIVMSVLCFDHHSWWKPWESDHKHHLLHAPSMCFTNRVEWVLCLISMHHLMMLLLFFQFHCLFIEQEWKKSGLLMDFICVLFLCANISDWVGWVFCLI